MLLRIEQFYGDKLVEPDDDIGHINDFYFEDQHWVVRYVVVKTGSWLMGRSVLLSPHAFNSFHQEGNRHLVNLTRKQIENSPGIESHKPISRQYENECFRYYGWPPYWECGEMWGPGGFAMDPPPHFEPNEQSTLNRGVHHGDDPHLRSAKALRRYQIQSNEGEIGHLTDLLMDDRTWMIQDMVVKTGHWYCGKEILISTSHVESIDYCTSKVFVTLTKKAISTAEGAIAFK